ncbi:uncharacterized protein DDB_G0284459-like [Battus philenor]|uniref:uncharacterized protein DDB_G0284459-like n=1 Tax=Battus philenor TaxID=42288 RepID=UPI0035D0EB2E
MKTKTKKLNEDSDKNKTLAFASLYKSAAETNVKLLNIDEREIKKQINRNTSNKNNDNNKNDSIEKNNNVSFKYGNRKIINSGAIHNPNKKIKKNIAAKPTPGVNNALSNKDDSKILSSSNKSDKNTTQTNFKAEGTNLGDYSNLSSNESQAKPKKRNKSVSFMLDENTEVAVKKSKSEKSLNDVDNTVEIKRKLKKPRKKAQRSIEHPKEEHNKPNNVQIEKTVEKIDDLQGNSTMDLGNNIVKKINSKTNKKGCIEMLNKQSKKETLGTNEEKGSTELEIVNKTDQTNKNSKSKKKKHSPKHNDDANTATSEPVSKQRKKQIEKEPEIIAGELQNLNIGVNAHSLSNLLDEMSVAEKNKKKGGSKGKQKKGKHPKVETSTSDLETHQEREKWKNRKWNKDKKGKGNLDNNLFPVIVENLPVTIILSYKKLLSEHFSKCGVVKKIGVVEVYSTVDPKPVFTTTIYFESKDGAAKALEEDNTKFEGSIIRVKQPLPPTQTTAVVKSYGELSEQAISSIFSSAGRIRKIFHMVKGRNSMATAFVEFDGPDAVERAIEIAEDTKIIGKNIYVNKFQTKTIKKDKVVKPKANERKANSDYSD